ncbi:MAG: hypothetical protein HYS04_11840 [Acidobacteria bacterium]|nr:hypothetical protein [Acidobacteriota bacterium]
MRFLFAFFLCAVGLFGQADGTEIFLRVIDTAGARWMRVRLDGITLRLETTATGSMLRVVVPSAPVVHDMVELVKPSALLETYRLAYAPIRNSLAVTCNGVTLADGEDYRLDLPARTITFTKATPGPGDLVRVQYRY